MALMADIFLLISALGAAIYCRALANRLRNLANTDTGLGGAISALNCQVSEMQAALNSVNDNASAQADRLSGLSEQANAAARRLEMMLATLHEDSPPATPAPRHDGVLQLTPSDAVRPVGPAPEAPTGPKRILKRNRRAEPRAGAV